jgi:ADP-ribose pyrophosphatase
MRVENEIVYKNDFFQVNVRNHVLSLNNLKGGAAILPVTRQKEIILIRIFRKPINAYSLEIPRGFKEKNETTLEAAIRELDEEIACTSSNIHYLGYVYPDSGLMDSKIDLYLALDTEIKENRVQAEEGIKEIEIIKYDTVLKMVDDGIINDAYTLAALQKSRKYLSAAK